jgi:formylglycine-generating enzyme required for sulfatase activity
VVTDQVGGYATGTVSVTVSAGGSAGSLYMIVDVSGGPAAVSYPVTYSNAVPADLLSNPAYKTTKIVMRLIPHGTFTMSANYGSEFGQDINDSDERQHAVTLTKDYYIGVFEVTRSQYQNVMGSSPAGTTGSRLPQAGILWGTIRGNEGNPTNPPASSSFVGRLSSKTGKKLDLPTEARWEYACRAGTTTSLNSGKNIVSMQGVDPNTDEVGWYALNSSSTAHEVGLKRPNNWGLYDMHGNVYEICIDYWCYNVAWWNLTVDPVGWPTPDSNVRHVERGSCYSESSQHHRSADRWALGRQFANAWDGFRIVSEL